MAWIKSFSEIGNHPKTRRLSRLLKIPAVHVTGHLHFFWHWCMDFAKDGDLSRYAADDIADAVEWEGDPKAFLNSMIQCGFIDDIDGKLKVHDWDDYGGKYLLEKQRDAERKKKPSCAKQPKKSMENTDGNKTSNGNINNSDGDPPELHRKNLEIRDVFPLDIEVEVEKNKSTTTNVVVQNAREENSSAIPGQPKASTTTTTDSSENAKYPNLTPERELLLNAVLDVLGKSVQWHSGNISDSHRRTIAKIMHQLEADSRTPNDVNEYHRKFRDHRIRKGRSPDSIQPPTPDQMLSDFNMVLNYQHTRNTPEDLAAIAAKYAKGANS